MSENSRLETIEIKLAHLERSLLELGQTVMQHQREIELLSTRNRALQQQVGELEQDAAPNAGAFEKPPHY